MQYKQDLSAHFVLALEAAYQTALTEAERAHATSTDKANIAENKYDTLAQEAAYLAQGQAKRASQCLSDVNVARKMPVLKYSQDDPIAVGALVTLVDQHETLLSLFLAPVSGGLKFVFEKTTVLIITPLSPLGKKLLGKYVDDEFTFGHPPHNKRYTISRIA